MDSNERPRVKLLVFGLAEVLLVTLIGNLLARWLAGMLFEFPPAEYGTVLYAAQETSRLLLKHGLLVSLGLGLLYLRWRLPPSSAGAGTGGKSLLELLAWGLVAFSAGFIPWHAWLLLNEFVPLGEGHELWEYYSVVEYTPGFILTILATAVLIPAVFEEIMVRGYMRKRLELAGGPLAGILVSSILFSLGHGHYYQPNLLLLGLLLLGCFGFVVLAYVTWRTNSVIPAIIAHALLNMPYPHTVSVMLALVTSSLICMSLARKPLRLESARFVALFREPSAPRVILFAATAGALMAGMVIFRSSLYFVLAAVALVFAWSIFEQVRNHREVSNKSAHSGAE